MDISCRYPIDPWMLTTTLNPTNFLTTFSLLLAGLLPFSLLAPRQQLQLTEFHLKKSKIMKNYWTSVTPRI